MSQSATNDHKNKTVTIIVNGRPRDVEKDQLTFDDVVRLAYPDPPTGDNIVITVTYSKGEGNKQGSLQPGDTIKAKAGMVFNVTVTDKS
jgi:hypothetical protein